MKPISGSYPSKDFESKNSAAFSIQLMFWILFIFFAVSKKMLAWVIWDQWCKIDVLGHDYTAAEQESEDTV